MARFVAKKEIYQHQNKDINKPRGTSAGDAARPGGSESPGSSGIVSSCVQRRPLTPIRHCVMYERYACTQSTVDDCPLHHLYVDQSGFHGHDTPTHSGRQKGVLPDVGAYIDYTERLVHVQQVLEAANDVRLPDASSQDGRRHVAVDGWTVHADERRRRRRESHAASVVTSRSTDIIYIDREVWLRVDI